MLTSDFEAFKDCTVSFSENGWLLKKQKKYNDYILQSLFCLTFFPIAINWDNFVRGGGFGKNPLRKSLGTWSRLYWRRKTTFLCIAVLANCSFHFSISSLRRIIYSSLRNFRLIAYFKSWIGILNEIYHSVIISPVSIINGSFNQFCISCRFNNLYIRIF